MYRSRKSYGKIITRVHTLQYAGKLNDTIPYRMMWTFMGTIFFIFYENQKFEKLIPVLY